MVEVHVADLGSIEYITIATNGNGIDFGDLTTATASLNSGGASSPTRCVFFGGTSQVSNVYTIQLIMFKL